MSRKIILIPRVTSGCREDYQQAKAQMEMKHSAAMMQMQMQLLELYKGH